MTTYTCEDQEKLILSLQRDPDHLPELLTADGGELYLGLIPGDEYFYNTFLLLLISRNCSDAATILIEHDSEGICINVADRFPTGHNTPIILAAKLGNERLALQLAKHAHIELDHQDYRGFTALHWAAILRMNDLLKLLMIRGARDNIKDQYGHTAEYYYKREITEHDLVYTYGFSDPDPEKASLLDVKIDNTPDYVGTANPVYSCIRWFLPQIIFNREAWMPKDLSYSVLYKQGFFSIPGIPVQFPQLKPVRYSMKVREGDGWRQEKFADLIREYVDYGGVFYNQVLYGAAKRHFLICRNSIELENVFVLAADASSVRSDAVPVHSRLLASFFISETVNRGKESFKGIGPRSLNEKTALLVDAKNGDGSIDDEGQSGCLACLRG